MRNVWLVWALKRGNYIKIFIVNNNKPTGPATRNKNKSKESTAEVVITKHSSIHLFVLLSNKHLINLYYI